MISCNILFDENDLAMAPDKIRLLISKFGKSYANATRDIIRDSIVLDSRGEVFCRCATRILSNFGMTRSGPFKGEIQDKLLACWHQNGPDLLKINQTVLNSGLSRDRILLEIDYVKREKLISSIWRMTKNLLPISWTDLSFGLVGSSKILFSVLPELVLPVDNVQWKKMFKTFDLGDVIRFMAQDIHRWEANTNLHLNSLDPTGRLSTLPAVYNVVAMAARPIG